MEEGPSTAADSEHEADATAHDANACVPGA
jgi:hypothetical protein